jgi:hypothetical protein
VEIILRFRGLCANIMAVGVCVEVMFLGEWWVNQSGISQSVDKLEICVQDYCVNVTITAAIRGRLCVKGEIMAYSSTCWRKLVIYYCCFITTCMPVGGLMDETHFKRNEANFIWISFCVCKLNWTMVKLKVSLQLKHLVFCSLLESYSYACHIKSWPLTDLCVRLQSTWIF